MKAHCRPRQSERGQILALGAVALVALTAIAAAAIDTSLVYSHRRQAQTAADSAAMAAALSMMEDENWQAAAFDQGADNGFDGANDPAVLSFEVFSPPILEPFASDPSAAQYIQVDITAEVQSAFAHMVFGGALRNSVTAIARAQPPAYPGGNHALFSTSRDECQALWFSGSGKVDVLGGSIFSNSDGSASPINCDSAYHSGSGDLKMHGNDILTVDEFVSQGSGGKVTMAGGLIISDQTPVSMPLIPEVPCPSGAKAAPMTIKKDTVLQPGNYSSIKVNSGNNVTLNPGIYCIDGDLTLLGGTFSGVEVLIKMLDGEFSASGNGTVNLRAPTSGIWSGLLFYGTAEVDEIHFNGGAGTGYTGTVYAPDSECLINGSSDNAMSLSSQMICRTIQVVGNGSVTIEYDRSKIYKTPRMIELAW